MIFNARILWHEPVQVYTVEMLHIFDVWTLTLFNPNPKYLSGNMVYQNRYSRRLIYL